MALVTDLLNLLRCHSTPGDETEVAEYLCGRWGEFGLTACRHGPYAVSAALGPRRERPTLLVCAHMDSPGFTVEKRIGDRLNLLRLGGGTVPDDTAPVIVKTGAGRIRSMLLKEQDAAGQDRYTVPLAADWACGDRVCFEARPVVDAAGRIESPFLDNRLGCAILCELAGMDTTAAEMNVVVGATGGEEFGGFGAPVLARAVAPDLVVCVDATYEDLGQGVHIGAGPVLTLSDASVLLSCRTRDRVATFFTASGLPLQTEVYNCSGTDSRAFPHAGLVAPVLALLLASQGNHTPRETASIADTVNLVAAIEALAHGAVTAGLLE